MPTEVMAMIPETDPLMIAWKSYSATEAYTNTRGWAANKMHVDGSLWAAFCAGWYAAQAKFCNMLPATPAVDGCQLSGEKCAKYLDEEIEMAARDLPEGWIVEVYVENGAAWVRLDHDGEGIDVDCSDMTLAQQVEACVRTANNRISS